MIVFSVTQSSCTVCDKEETDRGCYISLHYKIVQSYIFLLDLVNFMQYYFYIIFCWCFDVRGRVDLSYAVDNHRSKAVEICAVTCIKFVIIKIISYFSVCFNFQSRTLRRCMMLCVRPTSTKILDEHLLHFPKRCHYYLWNNYWFGQNI